VVIRFLGRVCCGAMMESGVLFGRILGLPKGVRRAAADLFFRNKRLGIVIFWR